MLGLSAPPRTHRAHPGDLIAEHLHAAADQSGPGPWLWRPDRAAPGTCI